MSNKKTNIGLLAVDSDYPNLALMKISAYHKSIGDNVEWYNPLSYYDKAYFSKIFTFTPDYGYFPKADKVEKGGTGYSICKTLPDNIDKIYPDYDLYPSIDDNTAYGFLTRGCPNRCPWCIVPEKEGKIKPYMDVDDVSGGRKNLILMDNNVLACDYGIEQIEKIINVNEKLQKIGEAEVVIDLLMDDGKYDHTYTFIRSWKVAGKKIAETFTVHKDGNTFSETEKSDFESYLLQILPPNLFRFYFFDGEKINDYSTASGSQYKDATHNVPAMVIGDKQQIQWASDDGEPQGTSGAPMVQLMVNQGLTNLVIVVTRYFGGIKLGTGGLVRAYTGSAKAGLEEAGICEVVEMASVNIKMDYTYLQKIKNAAKTQNFSLGEIKYEEKITVEFLTEPENVANIIEHVAGITNGTAQVLEQSISTVRR